MTVDFSNVPSERREMLSPLHGYEEQPLVSLIHAIQPLIAIVPDIEAMVDIVQRKDHSSNDPLSSDESASIMLYTLQWKSTQSSFRFILNETLRSHVRQTLLPWFLYLRLFMHTLSKLPSIPFHTVYRGLIDDGINEYSKGKKFIWWDFISCQSSIELVEKSMNENETRMIFIIECDVAKDISRYSNDEQEIILYPARQFEVISSFNCRNQLNFIQLKEIQPDHPLIEISQVNSLDDSAELAKLTSDNANSKHHLQAKIDQCRQHSKITLIKQQLIDADMHIVVKHAIINKQCKSLLLSENKITSIGTSIIAEALNNNSTLESLSLAYNRLGDEGVQSLMNTLSLNRCNLKTLSLHSTDMTDKCVEHLAQMLQTNTTLTWLYLGENQISDRGVELLAVVLTHHNSTLQVLALSNNKLITDSSVDYLVEMFKHNTSVETLWMNECNLSPLGREKLQEITQSNKRLFVLVV